MRVVDTAVKAAAAMVVVRLVDTAVSCDGGGGDGGGEGGGYGIGGAENEGRHFQFGGICTLQPQTNGAAGNAVRLLKGSL